MSSKNAHLDRQEHATARRETDRRHDRRRGLLITGGATVLAASAVVAVIAVVSVGSTESDPASGQTAPPWAAPANTSEHIEAAGLDVSSMDGNGAHFHTHLDVIVAGRTVSVPANIGADATTGVMSELHTHDVSGILHVEAAATDKTYTLGQVFTEWNVRLDSTHLGGLTAATGQQVTVYVDGTKVSGNPANVKLADEREIAVVLGDERPPAVPSGYDFPAGL